MELIGPYLVGLHPPGGGRRGQGASAPPTRPGPSRTGPRATVGPGPTRRGAGGVAVAEAVARVVRRPRPAAGPGRAGRALLRRVRRLRRLCPDRGWCHGQLRLLRHARHAGHRAPRRPRRRRWPPLPSPVAVAGPTGVHLLRPRRASPATGVPLVVPARVAPGSPTWPSRCWPSSRPAALGSIGRLVPGRRRDRGRRVGAVTGTLVERASSFLESRISRRSFINRSAYAGSAVAIGAGLDLALKPGTAYGQICTCGNGSCGCGSTCCSGFSEFCCSVNGGYNYCPADTVMGGWWKADNSSYCGGPRYYMDCNATCHCDTGCGDGWGFCEPGCDGTNCGCGPDGCDSYLTGASSSATGSATRTWTASVGSSAGWWRASRPGRSTPPAPPPTPRTTATAEQNAACWTPAFPSPAPPPAHLL